MQSDYFWTPKIDYLLALPCWEMHEAAFILADEWPKNLIIAGIPGNVGNVFRKGFNTLHMPAQPFDSKDMSSEFQNLFKDMEKSIEYGHLVAHPVMLYPGAYYGKGRAYFIFSEDVVIWALLNGYILPDQMAKALDINQIKYNSQKSERVIVNEIVLQYVMLNHFQNKKTFSKKFLREHEWVKRFGTPDQEKIIRSSIDDLLGIKQRKGGRPKSSEVEFEYSPQPIPSIMRMNSEGTPLYHFPLLKIAIQTATKIQMEILGKKLYEMTEPEFFSEFFKDSVVQLYLNKASINERKIADRFFYETFVRMYSHPKVAAIPIEERRLMKIGKLRDLNTEFCLEHLTKEERQLLKVD